MAVFRENRSLNVRFYLQKSQKAHLCAEPRVLKQFCVKVSVGALVVGERKNQKINILGVMFHPYGEKNPGRICTKFCSRD